MNRIKKRISKLGSVSKRKKAILIGTLALLICFGVVATMSGNNEITRHDGNVLVDSLNISGISGSGADVVDTGSNNEGALEETALVTSDDIAELKNSDVYFEEVRATINMDRNQIISMLTDVISQAQTAAEKENATNQKLKIIDYMEKERMIESLIETKGLPECLVLITDNAVNITVKKQDLAQSDVAKICDIIMRETGRGANQIVIQSKI
jgi:stage III sporulation protein AH